MNKANAAKEKLPFLGILAFSLCSVASVHYLLAGHAVHPHRLLWGAAALVEIVTAWLVFQVVEMGRRLTRPRISRGDRRFYGALLVLFVALALPSLALSIAANTVEFGTPWLGWVFPTLSVGCAVGAALPDVAGRHERQRTVERREAARRRAERARERTRAAEEAVSAPRWADMAAFLADTERPTGLTGPRLAAMAGISERSARRWLARARSDNGRGERETQSTGLDVRKVEELRG